MSGSFDFYGGHSGPSGHSGLSGPSGSSGSGAPGDSAAVGAAQVGTPTIDRWGLPGAGGFAVSSVDLSSPFATSAYATSRRHWRSWYALIAVVVIAVTGIAVAVLRSPHPVGPLPSSLIGLQKVGIPAAQRRALDSVKNNLGHEGLQDVSVGAYGASDPGRPGLVVISARQASGAPPDFGRLVGAMSSAGAVAAVTVTPQPVTGVITAWRCVATTAQGESVQVCAWQGPHAVLLGIGRNLSAADDSWALEQVRLETWPR